MVLTDTGRMLFDGVTETGEPVFDSVTATGLVSNTVSGYRFTGGSVSGGAFGVWTTTSYSMSGGSVSGGGSAFADGCRMSMAGGALAGGRLVQSTGYLLTATAGTLSGGTLLLPRMGTVGTVSGGSMGFWWATSWATAGGSVSAGEMVHKQTPITSAVTSSGSYELHRMDATYKLEAL